MKKLKALLKKFELGNPKPHSKWYQLVIYVICVCFVVTYYIGDLSFSSTWKSQVSFLGNHAYHEIVLFVSSCLVVFATIILGTKKALVISIIDLLIVLPHAIFIPVYPDALFRILSWFLINILLALVIGSELKAKSQEQTYIGELLYAQEEQRRRLSRDLHDGPVQSLVDIGHDIDRVIDGNSDLNHTIFNCLTKLRYHVDDILEQMRRAIHGLQPPLLEEVGLQPALMWLCDDLIGSSDIKIDVDINLPLKRIARELEIALFRIVQEALTNIKKHSEASKVEVELKTTGRNIELRITDNGSGFETITVDQLYTAGKFGLMGMRKRVDLLGGTFNLRSVAGKGTTILIEISI